MLSLGFDTATPVTTVAVASDGQILAEVEEVDPRRHAELLAPMIHRVLAEAATAPGDITDIVVGVGPGAFTGLRVGIATACALGDAWDVPVRGVVTLDVVAAASGLDDTFAVVMDARRREVYWATYTGAGERDSGPFVAPPDEVVAAVGDRPVVGAGSTPFADLFRDVRGPELPRAGVLTQLAHRRISDGLPMLSAHPVYLRRPDVTPSTKPKSVLR